MLDGSRRPEGALSQRSMHLVIGQLITDGAFRRRVERSGSAYLGGLRTQGIDLSRLEIAALIEVDPSVWASVAKQIHLTSKADRDARDDEGPRAHDTLTLQQQRVLTGVCDGLRNQDIATQLRISEGASRPRSSSSFTNSLSGGACNLSESPWTSHCTRRTGHGRFATRRLASWRTAAGQACRERHDSSMQETAVVNQDPWFVGDESFAEVRCGRSCRACV